MKNIKIVMYFMLALGVVNTALVSQVYAADVNWMDYEDARALQSDKPIFVFAKMRFCTTCIKMENEVFTDPELANMLNTQFIPVKETVNFAFSRFVFDDLKDKNGETLKFRGFPTVMVVKGNNYTLSQGFKSIEVLKGSLRKVVPIPTELGD